MQMDRYPFLEVNVDYTSFHYANLLLSEEVKINDIDFIWFRNRIST